MRKQKRTKARQPSEVEIGPLFAEYLAGVEPGTRRAFLAVWDEDNVDGRAFYFDARDAIGAGEALAAIGRSLLGGGR